MLSVLRIYNEVQLPLQGSLETAVRRVRDWCEMAASLGVSSSNELVGRQSPVSKDVNTEAEEATALEAVTRRQQVKVQQTEKASYLL
jgi:hypothetical protein